MLDDNQTGQHMLIKFTEHNHSPITNAASVFNFIEELKRDKKYKKLSLLDYYCPQSVFEKYSSPNSKENLKNSVMFWTKNSSWYRSPFS